MDYPTALKAYIGGTKKLLIKAVVHNLIASPSGPDKVAFLLDFRAYNKTLSFQENKSLKIRLRNTCAKDTKINLGGYHNNTIFYKKCIIHPDDTYQLYTVGGALNSDSGVRYTYARAPGALRISKYRWPNKTEVSYKTKLSLSNYIDLFIADNKKLAKQKIYAIMSQIPAAEYGGEEGIKIYTVGGCPLEQLENSDRYCAEKTDWGYIVYATPNK